MHAPRASKLALLALMSAVIVGCGRTAHVGDNRTLSVALSEYRINPSNVHVPSGELIIDVHNYGRLNHDLVISQNGQTTGQIKPLPPGQSGILAIFLAPGTYSMTSTILSDQALGAYGTLKVSR